MLHDPDLPAWKPRPDPSPIPWILCTAAALGWMLTTIRLLDMRRHLDAALDAKMAAEQEVLRERARPGLTHWEDVEVTWYGHPFHGRTASDGSRFDKDLPTCAHPSLPFGTVVVVKGVQDQLVPLIVTDRLPEKDSPHRLDVSELAAKRLGLHHHGRLNLKAAALRVGGVQ